MQPAAWCGIDNQFAEAVRAGLTSAPKTLPPRYFYDDLGSALFDAITQLPEYGLTRADTRVLERAALMLSDMRPGFGQAIELGSGSGRKTRVVLDAMPGTPYWAIDVSVAALEVTRSQLSDYYVTTLAGSYLEMLPVALANREPGRPSLLLFLGSTIGNFSAAEAAHFLQALRRQMHKDDRLLLGADLVKPVRQMLEAYDDPAGVTAAFNRNILGRINRELDADFDLRAFEHQARWVSEGSRIEMHLRATRRMRVLIRAAGFEAEFQQGETIWTESSHKYTLRRLQAMANAAGFEVEQSWVDEEWPFAESLWRAV